MTEYDNVEKPFMEQLHDQGWDIILTDPDDKRNVIDGNATLTLRKNFDEVILEGRLRDALMKLNSWLTPEQLDEKVHQIKNIGALKGLMQANQDFINLAIEQPTVSKNEQTGDRSPDVKVIDFEHPLENDFLAINQFRVNTPRTFREFIVPDIVLFINGLPIGVIECKSPDTLQSDPMEEGIRQLLRYSNKRDETQEREGNEQLFHFNQLLVSTAFDEARLGTITSGYDFFWEWKDTYPIELDKTLSNQQMLIKGALTKEHLIDLIRNFDIFIGGKIKIFGRYPQYRAVKKVIKRLLEEKTPERKSGVIWHTQGSGKSFSMVFLIRMLRTIKELKSMKVVIVTDRTGLEEQLSGTAGLAEKVYVIKNTKQLMRELKTDNSNLVMVMAQKFLKRKKGRSSEDELPDYEDFPVLNKSERILVLVDEAHRSQGGIFGENIANSLPNSTRIAFTGTPLITDKVKKKTYDIFGSYIDKYGMKQSQKDGATLQIKYEGKTVSSRIRDKKRMDTDFEDMFAEKTKEELDAIKKKYGTKGNVLESEKRIDKISKDIIKHYFENIFDNGFKAQIVASSRLAAVRYKEYIDKALNEYIQEYEKSANVDKERLKKLKFLKSVCRITWINNDPPQHIRLAKEAEKSLGKDNINFKSPINYDNPDTGISFLIVKDMLLTGFDAEIEQVMYVDKLMTNHTLLQAIARVNRVAKGKDVGHVVDYYGITNNLKKALDAYNEEDFDFNEIFTNITTEIPILKGRYEQLVSLFKDAGVRDIQAYVNYEIKDADKQRVILEKCIDVLRDVKTRADFSVKFKLFLKSMDILFAKPITKEYKPALKAFSFIHHKAMRTFRDNSLNIYGAGYKVRRLIDQYLISVGINTKIPPVDIISDQFTSEINRNHSHKSKASEMEHAIRKHCKINFDRDPVYFKKISEKLEQILSRVKENWEEQVKLMTDLVHEVQEGRPKKDAGLDSKKYSPFYDLVVDITEGKKKYSEKQKQDIKTTTIKIVDTISDEISRVGFWDNPQKQKKLRRDVDDIIITSEIPELYDMKDKIVTDLIKLAKHRTKELSK